jgi:hypothetical protein
MASEQGYSNQKKKGRAQFKTIHSAGSDAYAEQVIPKYLYSASLSTATIDAIEDVLGSNGQTEFWKITAINSGVTAGNIARMYTPLNPILKNFDFEVIEVIDADNFKVLPISPVKPSLNDQILAKAWVTANADIEGNPQISLAPQAIQFNLDGSLAEVYKDSLTPANNVPLPVEDLVAQASLSSIDGKFTTLNANDFATSAKQDTGNSSLSSIDGKFTTLNAKDFATSAKQDTGNSSLSSIDGKFTTLNAKDFATSAKQDTGNSSLSSIDGKLENIGFLDAGNSSTTPLGANAVFTGAAFDVTKYVCVNVSLISNVASAANGVTVEFSPDGTNWDHSHSTTFTAGSGVGYIFNVEFKYARVVYTNGAAAQSYFRLQTIFKSTLTPSSLYTLSQTVNSNMFAALGRSIITGETSGGGGGYVNVKVNPSGALTVDAAVTGSVSVSNFPATQPVSGSVSVSNFPATQAVTGTFFQATQPISGSVSVSNFPTTQNVAEQTQSGTITQIQKSVGLTAVRATVSGSAPGVARKKLMIKPSKNNTGSVYFGSSAVTTASGLEIIGPDRLEFELDASDYYLISDTAAQVVEIIEVV